MIQAGNGAETSYWLNDEIINAYINLIRNRTKNLLEVAQNGDHAYFTSEQVYICSTWFYVELQKHDMSKQVQKDKMLEFLSVLIPINVDNMHRILAKLGWNQKCVWIYDPQGSGTHHEIGLQIAQWAATYTNTSIEDWDVRSFASTDNHEFTIPRQENAVDCDVFVCKAIESFLLCSPLVFTQRDMNYVRQLMVVELILQKAVDLHPSGLQY